MPQMARRPFIPVPWNSRRDAVKAITGPIGPILAMIGLYLPWLMIIKLLGLPDEVIPSPLAGEPCDLSLHYWPACRWQQVQPSFHPPWLTAVSSSSPTSPMAMESTSALPGVSDAAPTPHAPIVSRGISSRPRPIGGSIRTKSQDRFRHRVAQHARMPSAPNMSQSPASAESPQQDRPSNHLGAATTAPRKRRDAAPRSG
jgi:hypothetical protein